MTHDQLPQPLYLDKPPSDVAAAHAITEKPPGTCCHYRYEDVGPKFDARTIIGRDGQRYVIPVMLMPKFDIRGPVATPQFFTPETCPVCEGATTCVECGREAGS